MQAKAREQITKVQRLYFGLGLLILSLGIYFRLNAHSLMWAHFPEYMTRPGYSSPAPYSGSWQDVMPFGLQETALIEVSRVLMGFGTLLSFLSLYWWWRFQLILLAPQNAVTDGEETEA